MAEEIILEFKREFGTRMMDKEWVEQKYKLIYDNNNSEIKKKIEKYIENPEEIELQCLETLYQELTLSEEEKISNINKHLEELANFDKRLVIHLPPIDSETVITYESLTSDKISDFKDKTSITGFINQTCKLYEEEDKFIKLIALVRASKKAEQFILNKKGKPFLDRLYFENQIFEYYKNELNEMDEYTEILKEPVVKCLYYIDELKIQTTKTIENVNIPELLNFLNNKEHFRKWFALITESETYKEYSHTKHLYWLRQSYLLFKIEIWSYMVMYSIKLEKQVKYTLFVVRLIM